MGEQLDREAVSGRVHAPRPIYVVACDLSGDGEQYEPIITQPQPDLSATAFDEEILPALPALWYAMHLPKTQFEVIDMELPAIRANASESRRHDLVLMPASFLTEPTKTDPLCRRGEPVIILCPAKHLDAAKTASSHGGFLLEPASFDSFSQETLDAHWTALSDKWALDWPVGVRLASRAPVWSPAISHQGSHLAWKNFVRLLGHERLTPPEADDPLDMTFRQLYLRAQTEALTQLEERSVSPDDAPAAMRELMPQVATAIRLPLAISLPGVSPTYERLVQRAIQTVAPGSPSAQSDRVTDADIADVLALVIGHQAAGDDSLGVVLTDPVPPEAFHALADLERHWATGAVRVKEEKLRLRLDDTMAAFWSDRLRTVLRSASQIDAYTNFPIGLLRLPGHSAPLAAQIPIAYRPLNPLTRTLQQQVGADHFADLSGGYTVLIAECINADDTVGQASRVAWKHLRDDMTASGSSMRVILEETLSAEAVRVAVHEHQPDILILSAHGAYRRESNIAGLQIGDQFSLGLDLGPMPPLVVLSACTSGPRGGGPVAVTDLIIRQGAIAVISTLVPVGVTHNSVFMIRLLHYINEAIGAREDHKTLLDLWHRVQTNTVIIDILYGNPRLTEWGHGRVGGGPSPIELFMGSRSAGRIRTSHLYEDAEAVLLEIAAEQGQRDRVEGWLRKPGYVPESMMYTLVGDPTRIRLRPSELRTRLE
jgi:hypothetical protein